MVHHDRHTARVYAEDHTDTGGDNSHDKKKTHGTSDDMAAEAKSDKWRRQNLHQCKHCQAFPTNHFESECLEKLGPCLRCGSSTHLRKDCPKPRGPAGTPKISGQLNSKERRQLDYIESISGRDGNEMFKLKNDRLAAGYYDKRQTPVAATEKEIAAKKVAAAREGRARKIAAKAAKQKEYDAQMAWALAQFAAGLGKKPKAKSQAISSLPELDVKQTFQHSTPVRSKLVSLTLAAGKAAQ